LKNKTMELFSFDNTTQAGIRQVINIILWQYK
jgi:hypothetical protein